ncbi:potassium/proton antiporter [Ancylobacter sp. 6x-1]|uniref:Potassium/proton antiporter n=1 Tax=Ancylobacter crimeensis TaxID=2579147 RepID=A0ABT0D6F1_9HYPH|nr:potassium/proton antiporter [Ancylobacter crimeensis]MCK0195517.1 potassium/proton antiporter [Ancylobacter crimeensis]
METITLTNVLLLAAAALMVVGIFSSLVASRFGAPLLLVFLVIGILAGEDGPGQIHFSDYRATYLVGSAALAIILFDGGLRTRMASFRGTLAPALVLSTAGVVITAAIVGLAACLLLRLPPLQGLLVGSVVASTDAAAVFFLLKSGGLQLRKRVGTTLEIESATNDPVAIFLSIVLVQLIAAGEHVPGWDLLLLLAQQAVLGAAIGVAGGLGLAALLNRFDLPSGLHPLLAVGAALFIFGLAAVAEGSGFLAVYLAGLVLGNRPVRAIASIVSFHDAATWLAQLVMFVMLGLLVSPDKVLAYALPAIGLAAVLIAVGRPVAVWLCLTPFGFKREEKAYISWVGLRGAVSIFLATIPTLAGVPSAEVYFNVAFTVVLVSLLLQGWTLTYAARLFHVALPEPLKEARRFEIDLPGQLDYELVAYHVVRGSPVLSHGTVPNWAQMMLVVRDGAILTPEQSGMPRHGDYAYLLAPPERVARLDRLFVPGEGQADVELAAAFPFRGDILLGAISDLYGLPVEPHERDLTIAGLFAERFDERPMIGNRVHIGTATLVVRAVEDDRVTLAGLSVDDEEHQRDRHILNGAALARLLGPRRTTRERARRRHHG